MGRSITRSIRRIPSSSKNNISLFNSLKIDLVFIYIYTQLYINWCYGYLKFTKITHFIYSFIRVYFFSFTHTYREYFRFGRVKCVLFIVSLPTIHYRRYSSMIRTLNLDGRFSFSAKLAQIELHCNESIDADDFTGNVVLSSVSNLVSSITFDAIESLVFISNTVSKRIGKRRGRSRA